MEPFFSIVIPTLNEENFLPNLLSCLTQQKKTNFEVIVVDGGSKDNTKKIVQDISSTALFKISLIELKKGNLSNQKNLGGEKADGKYLIFLDADMVIHKSFTTLAEKLIIGVKGFIFIPYVSPREVKEFPEISMLFPTLNILAEFSQNLNKPFSAGPSMIWEKNIFNYIGGFDNIFGEDHQIIRKARKWGIKVKFLPKLKIIFSLRRMKKEGRAKLFYNFVLSHIYLLFNDKLKNNIFSYKMGGQIYEKSKLEYSLKNKFKATDIKLLLKKTKSIFRTFLEE